MNYALHRGLHRRRPGAALQADLPPGGAAARHDGVASCPSRSRASTAAACTRTCRSRADGKNLFYDAKGEDGLSAIGWNFIDRILANANDICLILNSSVNSYRRLDPHFEAPNQIKASAINRGAMVRIPLGNEKSARVEVRSIAPDANPYLAHLRAAAHGPRGARAGGRRDRDPALAHAVPARQHLRRHPPLQVERRSSPTLLGEDVQAKYAEVKQMSGRPLPEGARLGHQDVRGPVPPRGDEPVFVEQVLTGFGSRESGRQGSRLRVATGPLARRAIGRQLRAGPSKRDRHARGPAVAWATGLPRFR